MRQRRDPRVACWRQRACRLAFALVGCSPGAPGPAVADTQQDTAISTSSISTSCPPPPPAVSWRDDHVEFMVAGGPGAYWFGMAETASPHGWTGEDCTFGYELGGRTLQYCHDAGDTGTSLTYGGSMADLAAGTTVFSDASFAGRVTYTIQSDTDFGGDGTCYVWGHDPSYYDGLGCTWL